MMKKTLLLVFCVMTISLVAQENGIHFLSDSTFDDALASANRMKRPLFVDCYTVWCGPCKYVDKNIFTQKEVGDFYNQNFACVRLNTELNCNKEIREKFNINGVPTFLYIDGDGSVFHRAVGIPVDDYKGFIKLGKEALDSTNNLKAVQMRINKGDRTPETLILYMDKNNKSNDCWKLLDDHYSLMSNDQKLAAPTWNLYSNWDKRTSIDLFHFYVENKKKLEEMYGKRNVANSFFNCMKENPRDTLHYNIMAKTDSALYTLFRQYINYCVADEFLYQIEAFGENPQNVKQKYWNAYIKNAKVYCENKDIDMDELNTISWFVYKKYKKYQDKQALLLAKHWTEITLQEHSDNCMYLDCYAHILYDLKKIKEAIHYEELAIKNGKQSSDYNFYVDELQRYKEKK